MDMEQHKKIKKIGISIVFALCYIIGINLLGKGLSFFLPAKMDGTTNMFLSEICNVIVAFCILYGSRQQKRLKGSLSGFFQGLSAGGFLCVYLLFLLFSFFVINISPQTLPSAGRLVLFTLTMFFIGLSEEIVFRGVIQNVLLEAFNAKRRKELYIAVFLSGMIFGSMHLTNCFAGVPFSAALIQAIVACGLGCYLSAIYLRGNNLWSVIFFHMMIDFTGLMYSGLLGKGGVVETVSSYGPEKLFGFLFYTALAVFLLRKSKMPFQD